VQIFVINLEKDTERRSSITGQLSALGLPFELVPGVYGAALSPQELESNYDDRKARWRMARSLVPAELGCALSHLKVYRQMIDRRVPCALVLEDDVRLPAELGSVLEASARTLDPCHPDVWLLSPAEGRQGASGERAIREGQLLLPYRSGFYTSSYLLTLAAAKALLAELYPVGDVADCWRRLNRYRVVDLFVLSPPLIHQEQERFGSSTTADYRAVIGTALGRKVIYMLRRTRTVVSDIFYAPYRRRLRRTSGLQVTSAL